MRSPLVIGAVWGASVLVGCHKSSAGAAEAERPPPGEVWLTPAQVSDAHIEVAPATVQDLDDTILTSGTVSLEDGRTAHVLSPVTGRVVSIEAPLGGHVHKGSPLAVIESPDIGSAVSDVRKAQADLIRAEHDLRRKKELFEGKAGSATDLESAEDSYRSSKAELERTQQKQALLRVGGVDSVTQTYTLTSPVDGEVLMRNISPGIEVQGQYSGGSGQELFTVGQIDVVWVFGNIYEMDLARVKIGAPAVVSVVAYPNKLFVGKVDWVSSAVDPSTRTASVRCTFDNQDNLLKPMMYATVQIAVDQKRAVAIPRNSLLRVGDAKVIFTEVGHEPARIRFKRVSVDVDEGEASPMLEVKSGLAAGDHVVTNGAILLLANLEP